MSFDRANAKIVEWADGAGMFKRAEDHGQLNFFINECEGMCGV